MILAISGKAYNGKTTAAKVIKAEHPEFVLMSFAAPLKRIAMQHFGLTANDIDDKKKVLLFGDKEWTVRKLLIEIGRMYRAIDPDFWVKQLWKDADEYLSEGCSIVIDDLRFKNEARFLKARGAELIRVERPGVVYDPEIIKDISETDLDDYEFNKKIYNDGSLEEYKKQVLIAHALGANISYSVKREAPLP